MPTYRKGLSYATGHERMILLEAAHHAEQEVLCGFLESPDRGNVRLHPDLVAQLRPVSTIRWFRHAGYLYVRIGVRLLPGRHRETRSWRVPATRSPRTVSLGRASKRVDRWGRLRYPDGVAAGDGGYARAPSHSSSVADGLAGPWPGQLSLFPELVPDVPLGCQLPLASAR